jgi:O-antigen/teichoic acid export membrane protein
VSRFAHINWALADQAIVSGTSFATTVLIARFLGMEELGRFALAWLGVFFAQNLQIALVLAPMMTIGSKQTSAERPAYFGAVALQQAVFTVAMAAFVFLVVKLSELFSPELRLGVLAMPLALLVLFGQIADCLRPYFFVLDRGKMSVALSAIRYGVQMLLLLALFFWVGVESSLYAVLLAMSSSALLAAVIGLVYLGPLRYCPQTIPSVIKRNWRLARWLLPNSVALWARENFVFTATGAVLGLAEVGALRAAQQIVYIVNVILFGFGNIVPIRASKAFASGGFDGLLDFIDQFVMRYNALISGILLLVMLGGEMFLTSIYGDIYSGYGYLIRGFALVMLVQLARITISTILQAMELTSYEFYASAAGFVLVAVASYPLVRAFGLAGAMLGMVLFDAMLLLVVSVGLRGAFLSVQHKLTQR